jgi:hypothetical protein
MGTKNKLTRERAELIKFITSKLKIKRNPRILMLNEEDILSGKVKPPSQPFILFYST